MSTESTIPDNMTGPISDAREILDRKRREAHDAVKPTTSSFSTTKTLTRTVDNNNNSNQSLMKPGSLGEVTVDRFESKRNVSSMSDSEPVVKIPKRRVTAKKRAQNQQFNAQKLAAHAALSVKYIGLKKRYKKRKISPPTYEA